MLDDVEVSVGIRIVCNALQAVEQVARVNANEPIDANIADVRRVARDAICYVAMFFNLLPAGAVIEQLRNFNTHQIPLSAGYVKYVRLR